MKKTVMLCMLLPLFNYAMHTDIDIDNAALQLFVSKLNLQQILEDETLAPQQKVQHVETRLKEHTGTMGNPILAVTNAFNCVIHDYCVKEIAEDIQDASERTAFIKEYSASADRYMR